MASLNQIAERIAYALNDPLNTMLRENLKFSIKYWRSMLIRRDIEKNGLSDELLQRTYIDLIKVSKADACDFGIDCTYVLRSKYKIPKPVRLKTDVLFKSLGVFDLQGNFKSATYVEPEEFRYTRFNRFTAKTLRYNYTNGYIYFFNNTLLKKAYIQTIFVDPAQINTVCDEQCYNDDMDFPCPDDMIQQIFAGIISSEFPMKTKPLSEEIDIDKEGV